MLVCVCVRVCVCNSPSTTEPTWLEIKTILLWNNLSLWAYSAANWYFSYFSQTICKKQKIRLYEKNKKNISLCRLLIIFPRMLSFKRPQPHECVVGGEGRGKGYDNIGVNQGPVVQSVVSLTTLLRVISLTVLADSIYKILIFFAEKMWVAFAMQKPLTFFQQNISAYLRITRCKF